LYAPDYKDHSAADMQMQVQRVQDIFILQEDIAYLSFRIRKHKDLLENIADPKAQELNQALQGVHDLLSASKETTAITGEEKLREQLSSLYMSVSGFAGKPTLQQDTKFSSLQQQYQEAALRYETLIKKHDKTIAKSLKQKGMQSMPDISRVAFDRAQ
jgi:hypothetical protein